MTEQEEFRKVWDRALANHPWYFPRGPHEATAGLKPLGLKTESNAQVKLRSLDEVKDVC